MDIPHGNTKHIYPTVFQVDQKSASYIILLNAMREHAENKKGKR